MAQTVELKAASASREVTGVATVLSADTLLQIDADIRNSKISGTYSGATADRFKATKSLSRQTIENVERQAALDATQQKLLESRLRQTWGDDAPFLDPSRREKLIAALSSGSKAIVRMDFPETASDTPRNVRVSPLSSGNPITVATLWAAPSGNLAMPGASYFGLIDAGPGLRPGDRARLSADTSSESSGVIIPDAAIVVYAGQSWCYIATADKTFERRPVPLDHAVAGGYLVATGFAPGTRVVIRGASLLLSREAEPEDDDDNDSDSDSKKPAPDKSGNDADDKPGAAKIPQTSEKSETLDKSEDPLAVTASKRAAKSAEKSRDKDQD